MTTFQENILPEFEQIREENETILWATKPKLAPFVLISLGVASLVILSQMLSVYGAAYSFVMYGKPFSEELFTNAFSFFLVALALCAWQYFAYQNESYAYSNKRMMLKTGVFNTDFIAVDYKKIIEVSVSINPIENIFGVGTVRFFTGKTDKNGSTYDCWHCVENPYEVMKKMTSIITQTQENSNQGHQAPTTHTPNTTQGTDIKNNEEI